MNKIVTKTCLCACALIISTANCFASASPSFHFASFMDNFYSFDDIDNIDSSSYQYKSVQSNLEQPITHAVFQSLSYQATEYLKSMRNADASQGAVLRGGKLELIAMAKLYDICIIVEETHQDDSVTRITINDGKEKTIILRLEFDEDGNCMFIAFLKAQGLDESLEAVTELRNNVVDYMSQDQDIEEKISDSLANVKKFNNSKQERYNQKRIEKTNQPCDREIKRRRHYSQEDNARLNQMKKDNPGMLTQQEKRHLYNLERSEQQKGYNEKNAKARKEYHKKTKQLRK